jgi:hypothetical protein
MMIDNSPKIGNQKNLITFPLGFPNPNAVDKHIDIDKCTLTFLTDYRRERLGLSIVQRDL